MDSMLGAYFMKRRRSLTSDASNGLIDEAYQTARAAGAQAGKLLGAQGGGFLLFIAPPERHCTRCAGFPSASPQQATASFSFVSINSLQ